MRILITGGASGLGEAITRRLARTGTHELWFTFHRSAERAAALTAEYPQARAVPCDFRSEADLAALCELIEGAQIQALVNNALPGLSIAHFHATDAAAAVAGFQENVLPTVRLLQKAVAVFRRQRMGRIVTVLSSVLVGKPPLGYALYAAEKAYLWSVCKSIAAENAAFNITCNAVSPAFMATPLNAAMDERAVEAMTKAHPRRELLTAEETASVVQFLLEATPQLNGVNLPVNAGAQM